jgi:hypothetical protein
MPTFNRPAYLEASDGALVRAATEGLTAGQPPHIEITGGKFSLLNAANEVLKVITGHLDVVILDINEHKSKVYYDRSIAYDPSNPQSPICWSDNGVAPSRNSRTPQSTTCATCEWSKWGSATGLGGSKIPACKDYKKIAVWCKDERSMQFLLRVPPNSFQSWNAHTRFIDSFNADLWQVLTRISFSADPKQPLTLQFDVAEHNDEVMWVPQEFRNWYKQKHAERSWDGLIGRNDQPIDAALALIAKSAPAGALNAPLPPANPATISPVEAAREPESPAPPVVRRGRPKAATPSATPPATNGAPELPAFIQRTSPGMVGNAPAPDAGLSQAMDQAFGTPK